MLTVIVSNLETLKRRLDQGDANGRIVDAALRASDKAAGLTRRLLAFARQQPLEPAIVNLNGVIRELSDFLRSTLGVRIELDMKLADDLWLVSLDPRQFEHALINLVANARDAMESGGRLTIETRNAGAGQGVRRSDRRRAGRPFGRRYGQGYRARHGPGDAGARLRTVLYHQADGQGDRSRP